MKKNLCTNRASGHYWRCKWMNVTLYTNKNVHIYLCYLTHFKPSSFLFPLKVLETLNYYTPWKHQKTFWCIRKLFLPCCTTGRPVIKSAMVQIQKIYLVTCKLNNFSDMKNVFLFWHLATFFFRYKPEYIITTHTRVFTGTIQTYSFIKNFKNLKTARQ